MALTKMSPKQQRICTCFEVCVRRKCKYNTEITLNVSRVSYDSVRTVMVFFISVLTNIVRFDTSLKYSCHLYKKVLFVFFVVCIACIHFFILLTSFFLQVEISSLQFISFFCNSIRFFRFWSFNSVKFDMDVLKPQLLWIGKRCFRVNSVPNDNNVQQSEKNEYIEDGL